MRILRRIDRCVIKELIVPLIAGTIIIALLFVANELIRIFKEMSVSEMPMMSVAQLILYRTPYWLVLTLPAGMAIGVSLAIGRLTRESEVTAMRAAGIPIWRILLPVAFAGLVVSAADFYIIEKVQPPMAQAYQKLFSELGRIAYRPTFQSDVTIKIDRYTASFGSVQRHQDGVIGLNDVVLTERIRPNEWMYYHAEEGTYKDGVWTFYKPRIRLLRGDDLEVYSTEEEVVINEAIRIEDLMLPPPPETETAAELWKSIEQARKQGLNPVGLLIEYHSKFSTSASCVIFALTSALAAMWLSRGGAFSGLLLSLGLVMLYYNAHIIATQILGRNGMVDPMLAAWLPNILYVAIGLFAFWRVR